jgi:hypothetical protein
MQPEVRHQPTWLRGRAAFVTGGIDALAMIDRIEAARRKFLHRLSLRTKAAGHSWRLFNESAGNLVDLRDVLQYGAVR